MTSAVPSSWRAGSGGGGATLNPTPPSRSTEVGVLWEATHLQCWGGASSACVSIWLTHQADTKWTCLTEECSETCATCTVLYPFLPFLPLFSTVIFSSMTSLQKEEFFDLVATTQARRLDDQRVQFERSPLPKSKARSFKGSIKQLSFVKKPAPDPAPVPAPVPVPVHVPEEDLYNMIRTTQVSMLTCLDTLCMAERNRYNPFYPVYSFIHLFCSCTGTG